MEVGLIAAYFMLLLHLDIVQTQPLSLDAQDIDQLDIQLVNTTTPNEGRVLIRWSPDSPWRAICYDRYLPTTAAYQMCRRLGFPFVCGHSEAGAQRTDELSLVNVSSRIVVAESCFFSPDSVFEGSCSLAEFNFGFPGDGPPCSHDNDLWLSCGYSGMPEFQLRQVGETYDRRKLVQGRCGPVHEWSAICGNSFYLLRAGRVMCRELGYSDRALRYEGVSLQDMEPQHRPNYSLSADIGCFGNETSLTECQHYSLRDCQYYVTLECFTGVTEYNDTGYLCGSKQLCGGRCEQKHPINGSGDDIFHYCQCDDACVLFDDCCYDYKDVCDPKPPSLERGGFTIEQLGCIWVPGSQFTHIGYVAVNRCPISWVDEGTRDLCERPLNNTDVVGSLPVYDEKGVDFKNIYCAICNGRSIEYVTLWNVSASGSVRESSIRYHPTFDLFLPIKGWVVTPPKDHLFIRECPAYLVDTCLEEFQGSVLEEGCKAYYAPIKADDSDIRYRNPHCAMCNGKSPIAESSCNDQTCQDFCDPWPWGGCSSICGPIDRIFTIEVFFEFASSSSASGMSCSERQIYDPFLGRCRVLTCAAGFQIAGDECVIEDRVSDTPMSNTINCLSETLGIGTSSVFTSEHQHEAPDPNATAQSLYIVMLSATYISDFELAFDKAVEAIGFDPHESPLLCNISQVSLLLPFALNISNHCINSTVDGSKLIPVHNDTLMKVLEYNANPIDQKYSKLKASLICLKILDLNCSSLLFLDHLEYHIVSNSTIKIAASGSWLSDGEYVLFPDGIAVVCSFIGPTPEGLEPYIRRVISFVGSCLSLFALAATFVTYCVFSELRSLAGKLVMNLTVALFTAILMFLVPGYLAWNPTACVLGAVLAHFAWLAAFTFMTVIAVNVERSLTSLIQRKELSSGVNWTLVAYMTLAWGMPFAIVIICLVLQYCDCTSLPVIYSEGAVCWITDATVRLVVFVVPVGISLVSSTSLYVVTVVRLRQRRRATQIVRRQGRIEGATKEVAIYSKLCTLIGVTWLFGFVSQSVTGILAFSYIYIILNYLQGVFIFIAFCLNKRVRGLWKEKLEGPKEKPKKGAPSASKNNTHGSNTPATISTVSALNVPEDTKL